MLTHSRMPIRLPMADEKIDLHQLHEQDYAAPNEPVLVQVNPGTYLSISSQGEPGGSVFVHNIGLLYSVAFTIKMTRKVAGRGNFAISKLEAQWSGPFGTDLFAFPKDQWCWKILLRTPDFITPADLSHAVASLVNKGNHPAAKEVQIEFLDEGLCVQMLHAGPYAREPETVALMQAFAQKHGLTLCGRHHEIYLSDPRRVAPEKLRTILRRPVKRPPPER